MEWPPPYRIWPSSPFETAALGSAVDMLMLRNQSEPDNRLILRGYSDENLNVRSQSVSKLTSAALKRPIARAHIA